MTESEILFERKGSFGVVTLNRPDALNALSRNMCTAFRAKLIEWERESSIGAVLVKGAGERAFCAGGDIRRVREEAMSDRDHACGFFHEEYRLNALIHHYSKPYVALIDGIVMGGGAGVSIHGDFRVVGDKTLFAMPETAIGLFPDVGGGHFLTRLHDGLGLYYALTGARAKAADAMAAGLATHYVATREAQAMERDLTALSLGAHAHAQIEAVLDDYSSDPGAAHVNQIRPSLKRLFEGHETFTEFYAALVDDGHDVANDMRRILSRMSPTSLKLTFEQMRRARTLDLDDELRMEYAMVRRVLDGHDFYEGVRAVLVDKDKAPRWSPANLDDVTDAEISAYFEPLDRGLTLP
ncbi:MAG: enoyl-CoA hydratase/isomerase family protein [Parvularculaceae bacterium]|nr:enoyl-CoA hydratase/isomerase family protein [Parvularculaceae bacterium]